MSKTCFLLKTPNFCTIFLYFVAEMSEKVFLHCLGHVLRLLKHI